MYQYNEFILFVLFLIDINLLTKKKTSDNNILTMDMKTIFVLRKPSLFNCGHILKPFSNNTVDSRVLKLCYIMISKRIR